MTVEAAARWTCDACGTRQITAERELPEGWWVNEDDEAHLCRMCNEMSAMAVRVKARRRHRAMADDQEVTQ